MKSESGEESEEYGVFSRELIVAAVLVGIFLMWVGQVIVIWSEVYKPSRTLVSLGGMISMHACKKKRGAVTYVFARAPQMSNCLRMQNA